MQKLSRRSLLKSTAATAAAVSLPTGGLFSFGDTALAAEDRPFFLFVTIPDGMDSSYLFDARPLALTAAGIKSNYLGEEPVIWEGRNGQKTLATALTASLKPFRDDFSVLNGVVMAASFDGHNQNLNFLLTGNPFGGDSFIPHLNKLDPRGERRTPLDAVQTGRLFAEISNDDASLPLSPREARALVTRLAAVDPLATDDPVYLAIANRFRANEGGQGRFSKAASLMRDGFGSAPRLAAMLRGMELPPERDPQDTSGAFDDSLAIVASLFKAGTTRSAVVEVRPDAEPNQFALLDTHSADAARRSGAMIGSVAAKVARIFGMLKATPTSDGRSLFDRTVILVASEFSRTMRQTSFKIDQTGTDHNPLTNSVLIGGAGIKGGLVLGESDTQTVDETPTGAHLALDRSHLMIMGRPFDFATMRPSLTRPNEYHAGEYLSFASVANTIYRRFGIEDGKHFTLERNGPAAPVISALLA